MKKSIIISQPGLPTDGIEAGQHEGPTALYIDVATYTGFPNISSSVKTSFGEVEIVTGKDGEVFIVDSGKITEQ